MTKTVILAAKVAVVSMPALAGGITPTARDPTWPQRLYETGYQLPSDVVTAAPFIALDPGRIKMACNADFALAQIVQPATSSDELTVEGLPPSQFKIATAHYGRVYQEHGVWLSAKDRGVQVRAARTNGTQLFQIVRIWANGHKDVDDFYLTTDCR